MKTRVAAAMLALFPMIALCAPASGADSSVDVDGLTIKVVVHPMSFVDCIDAAEKLAGREIAFTHVSYRFHAVPDPSERGRFLLAAKVDASGSSIDIPGVSWPHMTGADVEAVDRVVEAITVHERGHVAVAIASAAEVTKMHHIIVAGADRPAELALSKLMNDRQDQYDEVTAHGVHQSRAPAGLDGNDVRLVCRTP
jgi:hypothetical protein